ncbi:LacI family transcriptional regulator [Microbacterium sp. cx-55]|uniref:LacI family DNA-binding transcriptional regulator n=1 Tax=Microbacterium sp. cx-55 TaxID=2875948 RepID=UPI001CBD54FC|nr:LacI family DNA-binding transcriptional regulator [Microbacterium sp. cx-55]MBZ4487346.1 LacI family transcriptional regulator [Microbacterium sp. cx-55]UGB35367.1 LacI family transcriptional regulator [Microbacterium sp. cx-55]
MAGSVTIEEVARVAGVSRSTVSRVVNGSTAVSPEALDAVRQAIDSLNYVPNRAARSLASSRTLAVAVIVPEDVHRFFGDPFFASIIAGINATISASDYVLTLAIASNDPDDKMIGYVRSGAVDGAIIVSHHEGDTFVDRIAASVPVVFGGRPTSLTPETYFVDVDNVRGARDAVEYLLGQGHRSIATITGPHTMVASNDRLDGYRQALAAAGVKPGVIADGDFTIQGGAAAMRSILAQSTPDAVFVASDLMARGALGVLESAGLRVPEDVAVVGYDDSLLATSAAPMLTTMRQPSFGQGKRMAQVLLERLEGHEPPHATVMPTELIVRDSA